MSSSSRKSLNREKSRRRSSEAIPKDGKSSKSKRSSSSKGDASGSSSSGKYSTLVKALLRVGVQLVDENGLLRAGQPSQCVDMVRMLLFDISSAVADKVKMNLAQRVVMEPGGPLGAAGESGEAEYSDKHVVKAAFQLIEETVAMTGMGTGEDTQLPALSVKQFCKEVKAEWVVCYPCLSLSAHFAHTKGLGFQLDVLSISM